MPILGNFSSFYLDTAFLDNIIFVITSSISNSLVCIFIYPIHMIDMSEIDMSYVMSIYMLASMGMHDERSFSIHPGQRLMVDDVFPGIHQNHTIWKKKYSWKIQN